MPRPRKDLNEFRAEIEARIAGGDTLKQIRRWLAAQDIKISRNTLSARCTAWEASRHSRTAASEPALVSAVEAAFHTTPHDDETIACNINAQGLRQEGTPS
jgi:hypothetical protein